MSDPFHPLPLSVLLLLPFLLFIAVPAQSDDSDSPFRNCPSTICGNINISYPFWSIGADPTSQSQYCGYQGFGINCTSNTTLPQITLRNHSYYVRKIDYNFRVIILSDVNVSSAAPNPDPNSRCPRVRHGINLEYLPLHFSQLSVNLSFHFNCSGSPSFATPIQCFDDHGGNVSYVNVLDDTTQEIDWEEFNCSEDVVTTVYGEQINVLRNLRVDWQKYLEEGFELQWRSMDGCDKCEESDGRCGYLNTTGSVCFCADGTNRKGDCKKGKGRDVPLKVGIALGSAVFACIVMVVIFYIWRRRNNKKRKYGSSYMSRYTSSHTSSMVDPEKTANYHGVKIFKYRELEKATNYFDDKNELGDGGFGTVYQGKLKDGRVVAVKRLYENNYKRVEQFMNEVEILAHLRHRNLVSLYGCTTHHSHELLLVYEFIPNGTVADHLHGEKSSPGSLTWSTRMSIAIETASALVYLHASDVVHRDVKTNNILLDDSYTVKVADFGLSRLFPNNVTHVSTAPQGTPGYVDPEYHECYHLTSKSDVYSFGVVLIELISSKTAVDITRHRHEINLSTMAINKIQNDAVHELVDPNLGYETDFDVRKMINAVAELAYRCLQSERDCRPSMDEVLECLVEIQNGVLSKDKQKKLDSLNEDAVLLMNGSQLMSPDSVAVAWSTSTLSTSSG